MWPRMSGKKPRRKEGRKKLPQLGLRWDREGDIRSFLASRATQPVFARDSLDQIKFFLKTAAWQTWV